MRIPKSFIIILSLAFLLNGQVADISYPPFSASTTLLATWIEETMAYQGIPGMAIGVVYDQELL